MQATVEEAEKAVSSSLALDLTEPSNDNTLRVRQESGHIDGATTPQSAASHFSFTVSFKNLAVISPRANAEKILELLVHILSETLPDTPQHDNQAAHYHKFTSSLPINRILLLLLGERPTPHSAALILRLIGVGVARSPSFTRKFELVSGWNILKVVLPSTSVWDGEVDRVAWDLLLGNMDATTISRTPTPTSANAKRQNQRSDTEVSCPHVLPTILCALRMGLVTVADRSGMPDDDESGFMLQRISSYPDWHLFPDSTLSWTTEILMEQLIERMLTLHASSGTFRQTFESQQTIQLFIDAYNGMIERLTRVLTNNPDPGSDRHYVNGWNIRILEKLSHFGLALALDNAVGGPQKQEVRQGLVTSL